MKARDIVTENRMVLSKEKALRALATPGLPEHERLVNLTAIYKTGATTPSVKAYLKECKKLGLSQTVSSIRPTSF